MSDLPAFTLLTQSVVAGYGRPYTLTVSRVEAETAFASCCRTPTGPASLVPRTAMNSTCAQPVGGGGAAPAGPAVSTVTTAAAVRTAEVRVREIDFRY
jgi:hypothetical protein